MDDDRFEDRLEMIDYGYGRTMTRVDSVDMAGLLSLHILAVSVLTAFLFFIAGIWLGCLAFLVWIPGAVVVAFLSACGVLCGVLTIAINTERPSVMIVGALGIALNGAVCAACVSLVLAVFR